MTLRPGGATVGTRFIEGFGSMVALSVNVNKIATLRNSRTQQRGNASRGRPSVVRCAEICIEAGAPGITVHPRADARHITFTDVRELAEMLAPHRDRVELNLEGDPRPGFIDLVREVSPHQLTLVPVRPGELTSQAGWPPDTPTAELSELVAAMKADGIRVSVFVDPELAAIDWAAKIGADRIELYTEPYAEAWTQGQDAAKRSFDTYAAAAEHAHNLGLGINAGHDLDLDNLRLFAKLPHLDEVSIGHALIADAILMGLRPAIEAYLQRLR